MAGKYSVNNVEIRAYIKARMTFWLSGEAIHKELCRIYGPSVVSERTVQRWIVKFKSGTESLNDASGRGRKHTVVTKNNIKKVQELINKEARYTVSEIAKYTGTSTGSTFTILKKHLKVKKIAARWIPHLLTEKQERVKCAKKLLKMFPKYNDRKFSNIVTGDESWFHFFEPTRKVNNKIWATKHTRRPCIAKRMTSTKKVMYAMFFGIHGVVTQVPIPKGRTVTAKFYKRIVLNKVDKYYRKRRPNTGMRGLYLLHDNATPHKADIVKKFLESKRVTVLNLPPYSPDLAPCDFILFPRLKKHLQGRRYSTI
ncbi:histone-lysine N-methyltransferase SETMAR-like [Ruditapes philippinarum]|uniref:histone-lysine N-methyltransferase SETMAR-like n=1 Tax=Ruditapes philippinarum TaxID=129788 RepID=UPI00295AAD7C|nr:histone-lysine N-methyltransferase SETMAR-like [Ruditapes philippinarum]